MWTCPKCNDYRYDGQTVCNCKEFKIIDEDGEEYTQYGYDEHLAAVAFAEWYNINMDYALMDAFVDITVNGIPFTINAEPDVRYSAIEKPKVKS